MSVFFINDYGDNSYPVMCLNLKETTYNKENLSGGSFQSNAFLDASFDYYNIKNGYWEPFVEGLDIEFQYDRQQENSVVQVKSKDSINLNVSPDFVGILNYCLKSWEKANKDMEKSFKGIEEEKDPMEVFSEEAKLSEESKSEGLLSQYIEDQKAVDVATPYKVTNLTGTMIFVETMFDGDKKEKYILKSSQTAKIAMSYDQQTQKNTDKGSSKMNDNVKVQFEGLNLPIDSNSILIFRNFVE